MHQEYPFTLLAKKVIPSCWQKQSVACDFVEMPTPCATGVSIAPVALARFRSRSILHVIVYDRGIGIVITLRYLKSYFDRDTIRLMLAGLRQIILQMLVLPLNSMVSEFFAMTSGFEKATDPRRLTLWES
jgi:hypothetical protein